MFSSQNFIAQYQNTDTALVFVDKSGIRVRGINVCKYLNSGVEDSILWILLEGGSKLEFGFETIADAATAAQSLINALDTLQANCSIGGGNTSSPDPIPEPISISYNGYKALIANNTTVALQYYDIIDNNNALGKGFGEVFRCVALNTNDAYPQGILLSTGDKVILDFNNDKIADQIVLNKNITQINNSVVSVDEFSNYIFAINNSSVNVSSSDFIYAYNSIITASECQNILGNNAAVIINLSSNCSFKDVSVNLTNLGVFENIEVSNNSTGKEGNSNLDIDVLEDTILLAYQSYKTQNLLGTTLTNKTILLRNLPTTNPINAEFIFVIDPSIVLNDNTITVKDYATNTFLFEINSSYIGSTIIFKYDIEADKFIVFDDDSSNNKETRTKIDVLNNNQTLFNNVLVFTPKNPDLSFLTINGLEQEYNVDYTISNKSINWISTDFSLETTDKIYIIYR